MLTDNDGMSVFYIRKFCYVNGVKVTFLAKTILSRKLDFLKLSN